jgi:GNAT superfamily N-acetyltransferase
MRKQIAEIIDDRFIFHTTKEKWGFEVLIMGTYGQCFARAYWYNEDKESFYLNWLSVSPEDRKKGLGTELQIIREKIAKLVGAKFTYLQVEQNSWMHNWYERRGYLTEDNPPNEDNLVWMRKEII